MIASVPISLPAIFGWGAAGCSVIVAIWVGTVLSTNDQMAKISNPTGIIGKRVIDREGNNLGQIDDTVFHWHGDGYKEYAVLSLGGVIGEGEKHLVVPSEALSADRARDHLVLNASKAQLNGVPEGIVYRFYDRSSVAAIGDGGATAATSTYALYDEGRPHACECFWSEVLRDFDLQGATIQQIHVVTRR